MAEPVFVTRTTLGGPLPSPSNVDVSRTPSGRGCRSWNTWAARGGPEVGREAWNRPQGGGTRCPERRPCIRPLEGVGYSYWEEHPNPDLMLFVRFADAAHTSHIHNLHVVEARGDLSDDRLVFWNHLRIHSEATREYTRLKHILTERFRDDREAYTEAKTDFVLATLERARSLRE